MIIFAYGTKANLRTFGNNRGMRVLNWEGVRVNRPGLSWIWWHGGDEPGKFVTKAAVLDVDGTVITPAVALPDFLAMLYIHTSFAKTDRLTPLDTDPDKDEQWARSKIVRFVKNNGTAGTMGGISYVEVDSVRLFKPQAVRDFLASRNLPGHEILGVVA